MPCVVKGAQAGLTISAVAVQLISHGSEGYIVEICFSKKLQYSTNFHGSEGLHDNSIYSDMLYISMISHGSEGNKSTVPFIV